MNQARVRRREPPSHSMAPVQQRDLACSCGGEAGTTSLVRLLPALVLFFNFPQYGALGRPDLEYRGT